jgi:hypothetical protein
MSKKYYAWLFTDEMFDTNTRGGILNTWRPPKNIRGESITYRVGDSSSIMGMCPGVHLVEVEVRDEVSSSQWRSEFRQIRPVRDLGELHEGACLALAERIALYSLANVSPETDYSSEGYYQGEFPVAVRVTTATAQARVMTTGEHAAWFSSYSGLSAASALHRVAFESRNGRKVSTQIELVATQSAWLFELLQVSV